MILFPKGMIIAFEGLDCSFKETNCKAFYKRMHKTFHNEIIKTESFPRYRKENATYAIKQWLNGNYDRDHLSKYPLARNSFYAIDRFDYWFAKDKDGKRNIDFYNDKSACFIFDRYNFSNALYNPKYNNISHISSLDDFMFDTKTFGFPNPTIVVWMRMKNFDILCNIINNKEGKDNNETDLEFLKNVWDRSENMLKLNYGNDLGIKIIPIDCLDENDNIRSRKDLEEEIWEKVMQAVVELNSI